jgi:probable phosphoglycerate mutase
VLLARHAETDWNLEHRWQGHADPPLNERGRQQARALAQSIAPATPLAVYSSDLVRARATAEEIAAVVGVSVTLDRRLREVDVGEWSGLTSVEVAARYPEGLRRHNRGETGWEHGETYAAMTHRVLEALDEIVVAQAAGTVLVVTHGGPMRSVWVAAGGTTSPRRRFRNCEVELFEAWPGRIRPAQTASHEAPPASFRG